MQNTFPSDIELKTNSPKPRFAVGATFKDPRDNTVYRYVFNAGNAIGIAQGAAVNFELGHRQGAYMSSAGGGNTPRGQGGWAPAGVVAGFYGFVQVRGLTGTPLTVGNNIVAGSACCQQVSGANWARTDASNMTVAGQNDGVQKNPSGPVRLALE